MGPWGQRGAIEGGWRWRAVYALPATASILCLGSPGPSGRACGQELGYFTRSRKVTTSPSSTTSIRHVIESRHQENNVRKGHQDRPRFNACGSQSSLWPHPAQTPAHDRLPPARKSHVALKLSAAHTDASLVRRPYITNVTQGTAKVAHALMAAPTSSGPDQNQQAHGYSQRIGLEHKARLRSSRSEGAHQLPLLLLPSLSRDVSPTRSHAKQVPRSCEASVAQCLYPASFRVSLETSQQDESRQRRARFRSLRQQLREEQSKRRHIAIDLHQRPPRPPGASHTHTLSGPALLF